MPVKQCVVMPIFYRTDVSFDVFCGEIAGIGFKAVEIMQPDASLPALAEATERHGLIIASMIGHRSLGDGLNKFENHDRIEAELCNAIDLAARYGVGGLICFSGNRNPGQSDLEGLVVCAHGLRRIAGYAEAKGVNLNIELLNSKVDHPGYQCDASAWGVALCEMVNSPRVKLLFDIYHMQIMEGDIIRTIRKYARWIGHFHTAGVPGRHDLDEHQELNYRAICQAIGETGYEGYIGHEFSPLKDRMTALREAYAVCSGQ